MGLKVFSLTLGLCHPVLAKKKAGKRFFNFSNFLAIFFKICFLGPSMNGIRYKIVFLCLLVYLIPFWLKKMLERGFLIFWFFCYIFRNFLALVKYEWNSGLKYFSLFLGLSHPPFCLKIMPEKRFLIFLIFFSIFFGIFLLGSSMNGIRD